MKVSITPLLLLGAALSAAASTSVARIWNEENLAAIRIDIPHPPVHARNLFHVACAMYDAWAVYDSIAVGYLHHERRTAPDVAAAPSPVPTWSRAVPPSTS